MKCRRTEHLLNRYIDKELQPEVAGVVEKHLARCQGCTQKLNELTYLKRLVQSVPGYTANPFLWSRIVSALSKEADTLTWSAVLKVIKLWIPVAFTLILASYLILTQIDRVEASLYRRGHSVQKAILKIPLSHENMERIALNLLVYRRGNMEVNYALF